MKTKILRIIIALLIFILPFIAHTAWFYRGTYQRPGKVSTPDYQALELPQPALSTPIVQTDSQTTTNVNVLFDYSHGNYFKLSEIDPLTGVLSDMGIQVKLSDGNNTLENQLKNTSAYVVIAPTIPFTTYEMLTIESFINRGGKLLVIADPTRNQDPYAYYYSSSSAATITSVDICNLLLAPFKITYTEDYVYNVVRNEGNFRNVIFNNFGDSPLTNGIKEIVFYSAHSIKTETENLITGDSNTASSLTDQKDGISVAAGTKNGNVLAFGDLSFLTIPYNQVSDNQKLIKNIASFLANQTVQLGLSSIPYVFTHPVTIYQDSETVVDNNFLNIIAEVQGSLKSFNYQVEISTNLDAGNDVVFLVTYPPAKELSPYLESFGIEFSEEPIPTREPIVSSTQLSPTPYNTNQSNGGWYNTTMKQTVVTIPGLGKFPTDGTGLILFSPGEDQNTLTLMAASPEALYELAVLVFSEYPELSACLMQENMAACRLYSTSSSTDYGYDYNNYNYDYYYPTEIPAATESVPETNPTPTPVG